MATKKNNTIFFVSIIQSSGIEKSFDFTISSQFDQISSTLATAKVDREVNTNHLVVFPTGGQTLAEVRCLFAARDILVHRPVRVEMFNTIFPLKGVPHNLHVCNYSLMVVCCKAKFSSLSFISSFSSRSPKSDLHTDWNLSKDLHIVFCS